MGGEIMAKRKECKYGKRKGSKKCRKRPKK